MLEFLLRDIKKYFSSAGFTKTNKQITNGDDGGGNGGDDDGDGDDDGW